MASDRGLWPLPAEAPVDEDLSRCVHCGLCVNACPTYAVTGLETESPRGRIYMARAVDEGRIPLTAAVQGHWELCLQCRACEAVCPSGVPYGRIMEHARAQLDHAAPEGRRARRLQRLLLRQLLGRPALLAAAMVPARWFSGSSLRPLAGRAGALRFLGRLRTLESQLPRRQGRPLRAGSPLPVVQDAKERAVLFTGCVMGELFGNVHRATAKVLGAVGVQAEATAGQGCCGALHAHAGDLAFARKLARANIDALEGDDVAIVVNSAGCGAAMKEYGDLLSGDPRYAERALRFAARVRDFSEFIAARDLPTGHLPEPRRVTYQDPCHLAHAQGIRTEPRRLLEGVTGCELVETNGADMCCGAAGLYGLLQPEMSGQLRGRKAEQFRAVQPDVVVTANPGCQMQYEAAVREAGVAADVKHLAELLAEALDFGEEISRR